MMTATEARELRANWNNDVKALSRQTKAKLEAIAAQRRVRIFGKASKDELVNEILEARYPHERLNESIHVLYHVDGVTNSACDLCASVPGLAEHTAAAQEKIIEASADHRCVPQVACGCPGYGDTITKAAQ